MIPYLESATTRDLNNITKFLESCEIETDNVSQVIDRFVLLREDETLIGCSTYNIFNSYFELRSLAVHPHYRNRLYSNLLLFIMVGKAKSLGFPCIYVRMKSPRVIDQAKSIGFVHDTNLLEVVYDECFWCKNYAHTISTCEKGCNYKSFRLEIK